MSKAPKEDKKTQDGRFQFFLKPPIKDPAEENNSSEKPKPPNPRPSLKTIGLTDCSVCRTECSVVLTRSGHPFTACGKCGARTFYNSQIAIEILKRKTRELDDE
jgi:hypothetical protein